MPILVPSSALSGGGKSGMGALTGLLQGLAQGIPIGQQIQNRRRLTDLHEQEFGFHKEQTYRKNAKEDAAEANAQKVQQLLLEVGTMGPGATVAGAGPAGTSGAMGNGAPLQLGMQGPPTPEMQSPGLEAQAAPHPAQAKVQWVLSRAKELNLSPEETQLITGALQRDEHLQAVNQGADRIIGDLQQGLQQGAFAAVDKFGNPDQTGEAGAQAILDQISRADRSDPRHMAELLDKAENGLREIKVAGAQKETAFKQRQRQDTMFQGDMQARQSLPQDPSSPDVASSEMDDLYAQWNRGLISDEEMAGQWRDAKNGTLAIKKQMQQMQMQMQQMQMQKAAIEQQLMQEKVKSERYNQEYGAARAATERYRAVGESPAGKEYESMLKIREDREREKARAGARGAGTPAKPPSPESNARALKMADEHVALEPDSTPAEQAAKEQKRQAFLRDIGFKQNGKAAGGGGVDRSALDSIRERASAEGWDEARVREEMEKLGIDPDTELPD
jgi:hypothetical protein